MKVAPKPAVVQAPDQPEVGAQIIAQSIVQISESMKAILRAGLKRQTIITLIHAHSGVPKRSVELVLNNLEALREIWCTR